MKRSGNKTKIIENDGVIIGVSLPADYTAEHEMGIKPLLASIGIDCQGTFLEGRSMRNPMPELYDLIKYEQTNQYFEEGSKTVKSIKKKDQALALVRPNGNKDGLAVVKDVGRRYNIEADITGAWDNREFLVVGWTDKGFMAVRLLAEGLGQGDLTVWTNQQSFAGIGQDYDPGLVIVRTSLVSDAQRENMRQ